MFISSTDGIPPSASVPRHISIIMDGNGRWAKQRFLPRVAGHRKGADAVRATVKRCVERGVEYLTLFAFSSENWRRPAEEVSVLKQLFHSALEEEVGKLHENGIRLRVVGNLEPFGDAIVRLVEQGEALTADNRALTLTIAANYGGRWDLMQAMNALSRAQPERVGNFTEADLTRYLALSYAPEPDLFIRTGGEQRISNFLLWQLAYCELYFTDMLWPDFDETALDTAISSFQRRERRFGRTSEQVAESDKAAVSEPCSVVELPDVRRKLA